MRETEIGQVARFWNNVAQDFDRIYTGEKSAIARTLDLWLRRDMYQRFDWVMARAGDALGSTVCDIGCGSGRFVAALAERGAARVVGVDVAPAMLRIAANVAREAGVADRCDFVNTDVLDWHTTEKFDMTIAIGLWDYIADPASRLTKIRHVTKGRFLSAWPRLWTWRMPIRKVRLNLSGCPVYFYRRADAVRLLEQAHFTVTRVDVVGKLYCIEAKAS